MLISLNMNSEQDKIKELGYENLEKLTLAGKDVSTELFLECLSHPYKFIRAEAISQVVEYRKAEFTWIFAVVLNDKSEYVAQEAAKALAKINSDKTLEILSDAFFSNLVERPYYIADAISEFGESGQKILLKGIKSNLPNIRYFSAKFLGSKNDETTLKLLQEIAESDDGKTTFGGLVSTSAKRRLRVLLRNKPDTNL